MVRRPKPGWRECDASYNSERRDANELLVEAGDRAFSGFEQNRSEGDREGGKREDKKTDADYLWGKGHPHRGMSPSLALTVSRNSDSCGD